MLLIKIRNWNETFFFIWNEIKYDINSKIFLNKYLRFGKLRGPYLFTSYQFAKFKDQINIGPGY